MSGFSETSEFFNLRKELEENLARIQVLAVEYRETVEDLREKTSRLIKESQDALNHIAEGQYRRVDAESQMK